VPFIDASLEKFAHVRSSGKVTELSISIRLTSEAGQKQRFEQLVRHVIRGKRRNGTECPEHANVTLDRACMLHRNRMVSLRARRCGKSEDGGPPITNSISKSSDRK